MIPFKTVIQKFAKQGEKTGWSYLEIPEDIASRIKPGWKKSFRVKGYLDTTKIERISLLPMGKGNYIIPLNAALRKALGKRKGAEVALSLTEDKSEVNLNSNFLECLKDEPGALRFFNALPGSHRTYFSKWIDSAKTETTKVRRIARAVTALARQLGFAEMMRAGDQEKGIFKGD